MERFIRRADRRASCAGRRQAGFRDPRPA
jgi:hypothetical protein